MTYRLAKSLEKLRDQIDAAAPNRSKASDGWIGDAAHFKTGSASDHNPWFSFSGIGIVTALDVTNDPDNGCDVWEIAQAIAASKDGRLKYLIYTGQEGGKPGILSQTVSPWVWRERSADDHQHHLHVSVNGNSTDFDDTSPWLLSRYVPTKPVTKPVSKPSSTLLVIDGDMGVKTITMLQRVLRTPVDGKISTPSMMVSALQRFLNSHLGGGDLVVDGKGLIQKNGVRTHTNEALQRYLGTIVDGTLSSPDSLAVRRLQQRLNTGRL